MQTLVIDLSKNPEVRDLVVDMEPGDRVKLHTSIKALDDQTLTLTLDEAEEGDEIEEEDAVDDEDDAPVEMNTTPGRAPNEGGDGGRIAAALES